MKQLLKYILITIFIACAFQLVSCSPQKRAQRHIKKALRLDPTILQKDTIKINDTILTKKIEFDTIIDLKRFNDTLYIERDKLSLRIIKLRDSVYIDAKCDADTIYYNNEIQVDKLIYKN